MSLLNSWFIGFVDNPQSIGDVGYMDIWVCAAMVVIFIVGAFILKGFLVRRDKRFK